MSFQKICSVKKVNVSVSKMTILFAMILVLFSCQKDELVDPFWEINLKSDISNINNFLYKKSHEGEIIDCVFSFDKKIYIKKEDFDARINTSIDLPKITNNQALKIDYTIIAEFKNEKTQSFNPAFFNHFLDQMKSSYGTEIQNKTDKNKIHLLWDVENKVRIEASVLKDINLYMISIVSRI